MNADTVKTEPLTYQTPSMRAILKGITLGIRVPLLARPTVILALLVRPAVNPALLDEPAVVPNLDSSW